MDDNAYDLEALIRSNPERLHHTLEHRCGKVKTIPSKKDLEQERFIMMVNQSLFSLPQRV